MTFSKKILSVVLSIVIIISSVPMYGFKGIEKNVSSTNTQNDLKFLDEPNDQVNDAETNTKETEQNDSQQNQDNQNNQEDNPFAEQPLMNNLGNDNDEDQENVQKSQQNDTDTGNNSPVPANQDLDKIDVEQFSDFFKLALNLDSTTVLSGSEQVIRFMPTYTAGDLSGITNDMLKIQLTFPKQISSVYTNDNSNYNFEQSVQGDQIIMTVGFKKLVFGSGSEGVIRFKSKEGGLSNNEEIKIQVKVLCNQDEIQPLTQDLSYNVKVNQFAWSNLSSSITPNNVTVVKGQQELEDIELSYSISNSKYNVTGQGVAFTNKVVIIDTINVDENILITKEQLQDISFPQDIESSVSEVIMNEQYVKSFKVAFVKQNTEAETKDIEKVIASFKISGIKLRQDTNSDIEKAIYSQGAKAEVYPLGDVDSVQSPLIKDAQQFSLKIKLANTTEEDYSKSQGITKNISQVANRGISSYVYPGEQIVYTLNNFRNNQTVSLENFTVTDIINTNEMYPITITTGRYNNAPQNKYKIILYNAKGIQIGFKDNLGFDVNTTINLSEITNDPTAISKIDFQFGTVPKSFGTYNYPTITTLANKQTDTSKTTLTNTAKMSYTYNNIQYSANNEAKIAYVEQPQSGVEKYNKQVTQNISRPGSTVILSQDLLEYTITFKNSHYAQVQNIEVQDSYVNQKPYISGNSLPGYDGKAPFVKIVEVLDKSGKKVENHNIKIDEQKTVNSVKNGSWKIYLKGILESGYSLKVSYVMQVDNNLQHESQLNNQFDAYGYGVPAGGNGDGSGVINPPGGNPDPEDTRIHLGQGYIQGTTSTNEIPSLVFSQTVTPASSNQSPLVKDNRVIIKIDVVNNSDSSATPLDITGFMSTVNFNRTQNLIDFSDIDNIVVIKNTNGKSTEKYNVTAEQSQENNKNTVLFRIENGKSIQVQPRESVEIQINAKISGWAQSNQTDDKYIKQVLTNYVFLKQQADEYNLNSSSATKENNVSNLDKNKDSKSFVRINQDVYCSVDTSNVYAGISYVNSQTITINQQNVQGELSRQHNFTIHNYGKQDLVAESLLIKLPEYESYKEFVGLNSDKISNVSFDPDTKILQATFKEKLIIKENQKADFYLKTVITEKDMEAAQNKKQESFTSKIQVAFTSTQQVYSKKTNLITQTTQGEWGTPLADGKNVYYGTEFNVSYALYSIQPGIVISPQKITDGKYSDIVSNYSFTPSDYVGWKVTVQSYKLSQNVSMKEPVVLVKLPYGMTFEEIKSEDTGMIQEHESFTYNNVDYVLFKLNDIMNNPSYASFSFKTDTSSNRYGLQAIEAYVIPQQFFNKTISSMGQIQYGLDLNNITGKTEFGGVDFSKPKDAVKNTGTVAMYGIFAFESQIDISVGEKGESVAGPGTMEVPQSVQDFTYTLTLRNSSDKSNYENVTIIDRLPAPDDFYSISPISRGSNISFVLDSEPIVKIEFPQTIIDGVGENEKYSIEYLNVAPDYQFGPSDFGINFLDKSEKAERNSSNGSLVSPAYKMNNATAFKIKLDNGLPMGATVKITFKAKISNNTVIMPANAVAVNSFGFAFTASNSQNNKFQIMSEPSPVTLKYAKQASGSIGGTVFMDSKGDGKFDISDSPVDLLNQKSVTLCVGNTPFKTTTTDQNGSYMFGDLPLRSDYNLVMDMSNSGYKLSSIPGGANPEKDNQFDPKTYKTSNISLTTASQNANRNAHLNISQSVFGNVFVDKEDNGVYTTDKSRYTYSQIDIELISTSNNQVVKTASTNTDGSFVFDNVPNGNYKLKMVSIPGGYPVSSVISSGNMDNKFSPTGETSVFAVNRQSVRRNAGLVPQGKIQLNIFLDSNQNGVYDPGEGFLLEDVDVKLFNNNNIQADHTINSGQNEYKALEYNSYYQVQVDIPHGYKASLPQQNSDFTVSNNIASTSNIILTTTNQSQTINLGVIKSDAESGMIEGVLFIDNDEDQHYSDGVDTILLAKATIDLVDINGTVCRTIETTKGSYRFNNVEPNDYYLRISTINGYTVVGLGNGEQGNKFNPNFTTDIFTISSQSDYYRKNAGFTAGKNIAIPEIPGETFIPVTTLPQQTYPQNSSESSKKNLPDNITTILDTPAPGLNLPKTGGNIILNYTNIGSIALLTVALIILQKNKK